MRTAHVIQYVSAQVKLCTRLVPTEFMMPVANSKENKKLAMKPFHILGIEFIRTVDILNYAKESSEPHYYHLH